MIKAQKHSKDINKMVHVTPGVNRNFTKLREYFLCAKKTKEQLYLMIPSLPGQSSTTINACAMPCSQAEESNVYEWWRSVFVELHKITVEPLMSNRLFYVSVP